MAIDSLGNNAATTATTASSTAVNPNGILGKDDFLNLLLLELKYQDPTDPMDTEKILTQTSQLAALESSENTNKALEDLAVSLSASMQFSTISAIGKIADTGSNAIVFEEGKKTDFELYFPQDVTNGSVKIMDVNGKTIKTIPLETTSAGTHLYSWNGADDGGSTVKAGVYYAEAAYTDSAGQDHTSRVGTYPIESVRFDNGKVSVKMGSNYVPFESIKEIVGG